MEIILYIITDFVTAQEGWKFMTPKIAALDLDETLLHSDMTISEYSRNVIRQVQQKGIHVVIATGRMFSSACLKARELDIGNVPVICYTGAWIGLCESGTVLHKDSLPLSEARSVLALARRKGWMIQSYINDVLCLPEEGELEKRYSRYRSKPPVYLGEAFWEPAEAPTRLILIEADPKRRQRIREELSDHFGDAVDMVYPGDDFIDIHKKGVSKASALRILCRQWKIGMGETAAFGNSENDVSMLREAGWSYAVSNAEPAALAAARFHIESNDRDGVARVLETFL